MRRKTNSEFIQELKNIQPDLYVIGEYVNVNSKILVSDINGIEYLSRPSHLLNGRMPGIRSAVDKSLIFKRRAKLIHGDRYDYSLAKYVNIKSKIIITCKEHGNFEQTPTAHLQGEGCLKCATEDRGWTKTKWKNAALKSKHFESFKVYIIQCWNKEEEFYKIGKTYRSFGKRFGSGNNQLMPYNFGIVKVIEGSSDFIFNLELYLHKINKEYRYAPNIKFHGHRECFSTFDDNFNVKNF